MACGSAGRGRACRACRGCWRGAVDGLDADGEDGGDLLGAVSFGDELDDLRLAGGEDVVYAGGLGGASQGKSRTSVVVAEG